MQWPPPRSARAHRRRRDRAARRRVIAGLLLLGFGVGAGVLAPGAVEFDEVQAAPPELTPPPTPALQPTPFQRPLHRDLSMGPLLALLDDALAMQPLDLRRPLRVPFNPPRRPAGDDILLRDPARLPPPALLPVSLRWQPPVPDPPHPPLAGFSPLSDPGMVNPNGAPFFNRDLLGGGGSLRTAGGLPPLVPEPSTALLVFSGLVGLGIRARRGT